MRSDRLFSGLVLVIIGIVFLLHNFNVIDFHWGNLFRLWPVFLVIGGVNLLLANTRAAWATAVKILVLVVGLGFVLFANIGRHGRHMPFFSYHYDDNDEPDDQTDTTYINDDIKGKGTNNIYQQAYFPDMKLVKLNISGGATSYVLNGTTDSVFRASTKEYFGDYSFTMSREDTVTELNFDMNKHNQHFSWDNGHMNEARISLSTIPVWDINLKGGAAEMKFDLTPFKVRNLSISGGATSSKIKLANNMPVTEVSVSTGASEVEISIPKNAACDISVSTGLSSNDFDGFTKISSSHYTTPGFAAAKNKIYLKLKGGVSDFNVRRY